jgi:hypothetical protein
MHVALPARTLTSPMLTVCVISLLVLVRKAVHFCSTTGMIIPMVRPSSAWC